MGDSSSLPPDDKAMPLDLSCKKCEDEEGVKDDDVIMTLEIPACRNHVLQDPILISESDSDSDITIVAVNVTRTKSKNLQKPFNCKKMSCDSDSDGDDCIIASYEVPLARVGMKEFFNDTSLQVQNDAILDNSVVKVKDTFMSDASSRTDVPNVELMISLGDNFTSDDRSGNLDFETQISPISMHLGILGTKSILTPPQPMDCVSMDNVNLSGLVDSVDNGLTKIASKMAGGSQHSASDLVPDNSLPKTSDLMMSDCVSSDGLSFGITQLLSSPCKAADASLTEDTKSTVDVNSIFHVSSFDHIMSDKWSKSGKISNVTEDKSKRKLSFDILPLAGCSDFKSFHSQLHSMRNNGCPLTNFVPGGKPKSSILSALSLVSNGNSKTSDSSCKKFSEDWKVVSNCKNKVILRRSDGKMVSPSFLRKRDTSSLFGLSSGVNHRRKLRRLLPFSTQPAHCFKSLFLRKRDSSSLFGLSPGSSRKKFRHLLPLSTQPPHCFKPQMNNCDSGSVSALVSSDPSGGYDSVKLNSEPEHKMSYCYGCEVKVDISHLSFCMAHHGCCGKCLQSQVKTLLARGKKGTLKCQYVGCNSFYLVSQLRNSLPAMVVEILEEKLDREYCDNAARLMMQDDGKESVEEDTNDRTTRISKEEQIFPQGWEPMSQSEEYCLVDVRCGSDEYNYISETFHMTMNKPRANIVKIQRVQNTILWEFYMVKKKQMERDNGKTVLEKSLFHGTHQNVVEAICRTNFDWRLCGVHGTMYGQGSYFARDASYSHLYTDRLKGCRALSIHSSSQMFFNSPPSLNQLASAPAAQIIMQPFAGSGHSVSIAALQSCRFARLPVLSSSAHLSHSSSLPPPVGQGATAALSALTFPYWFGNNGIHGSLGSGKVGRSTVKATGSHTATPRIHTMFVARVLVGEYAPGKAGYRKPPPVDPDAPYGRCYDACVNDMTNPTIFVIFNSAQCYPEYIIEYTNRGKDA